MIKKPRENSVNQFVCLPEERINHFFRDSQEISIEKVFVINFL